MLGATLGDSWQLLERVLPCLLHIPGPDQPGAGAVLPEPPAQLRAEESEILRTVVQQDLSLQQVLRASWRVWGAGDSLRGQRVG